MELASEMVIKAAKADLDIRQFPIEYHPRQGESKLSTWSDGWRHLRFLLVHSPKHLFLLPGTVMVALGRDHDGGRPGQRLALRPPVGHPREIGGSLLLIIGVQVVALGLCALAYGVYFMGEQDDWFNRMRARFRLEHGLMLGGSIMLAGIILGGVIVVRWIDRGFGSLSEQQSPSSRPR